MIEDLPTLSPVRVEGAAGTRPLGIRVYAAWRLGARLRGLLFRPPLGEDEGLLLCPCAQIHTLGLGYPLDLAYLDKRGVVVKCVSGLAPNRISGAWRGRQVLELAAGGLARTGLQQGERLCWDRS